MKTPRQILLERHRSVNGQLDDLRARVVANLAPSTTLWQVIWTELFYSARRAWMGLGVAWCAIALLLLASPDPEPALAQSISPTQLQLAFEQRQRLLADLNDQAPATKPPKSAIPGRRSERLSSRVFA